MSATASTPVRDVVLGRNSKVWRALASDTAFASRFVPIGHAEVASFAFTPNDRVWVFAYSREHNENVALLRRLHQCGVRDVVYISSAATIVSKLTRCYEYPRVKLAAQEEASRLLRARIVVLGYVYEREEDLPSGVTAATSHADLRAFMQGPPGNDREVLLFKMVSREFGSGFERSLFLIYANTQWLLRRWPCALRPLDLVLRALGYRWYGYLSLSNRLWTTTK